MKLIITLLLLLLIACSTNTNAIKPASIQFVPMDYPQEVNSKAGEESLLDVAGKADASLEESSRQVASQNIEIYLLVFALNLSSFKYEIMNNCESLSTKDVSVRLKTAILSFETNGGKCTKVPNLMNYSCDMGGIKDKKVFIELYKDKELCKSAPGKLAKQMKFFMKK